MNAKNALVSIFLSVLVVSCRSTLPQQGSELKSAGAFSNNHVAMRGGKDETATTATHQHFLQGIIMQTPEGWMRLDMLEETARSYLSKRYKAFPPATPLGLSVEFAPTNHTKCLGMYYYGRFGEAYWAVTFDSFGKVSGHVSGVNREY